MQKTSIAWIRFNRTPLILWAIVYVSLVLSSCYTTVHPTANQSANAVQEKAKATDKKTYTVTREDSIRARLIVPKKIETDTLKTAKAIYTRIYKDIEFDSTKLAEIKKVWDEVSEYKPIYTPLAPKSFNRGKTLSFLIDRTFLDSLRATKPPNSFTDVDSLLLGLGYVKLSETPRERRIGSGKDYKVKVFSLTKYTISREVNGNALWQKILNLPYTRDPINHWCGTDQLMAEWTPHLTFKKEGDVYEFAISGEGQITHLLKVRVDNGVLRLVPISSDIE